MNPSTSFTAVDVGRWFSAREIAKAQAILDAVSNLEIDETSIAARVQGTAPLPYQVKIRLAPDARGFPAKMACTCPVGGYCKHTAAVLLKTVALREPGGQIAPAALEWIEALRQLSAPAAHLAAPAKPQQRLYWMLDYVARLQEFRLSCCKGQAAADGSAQGRLTAWHAFDQALAHAPAFTDEEDLAILQQLLAQRRREESYRPDLPLAGRQGAMILDRLLATGRLYVHGLPPKPLQPGAIRPARIEWRQDAQARFYPQAMAEPGIHWALPFDPPRYVDIERHEIGELKFAAPPAVISRILAAPPLNEAEARLASEVLAEAAPGVPPPAVMPARVIDAAPLPLLKLGRMDTAPPASYRKANRGTRLEVAQAGFRYGEIELAPHDKREISVLPGGEPVRIKRRFAEESRWMEQLQAAGLEPVSRLSTASTSLLTLHNADAWAGFMIEALPQLRAEGWEIEVSQDFPHRYFAAEAWEARIAETEDGKFDVDMGIVIEGRRLPLAPLLAGLFRRDPRWLDAHALQCIDGNDEIDLVDEEGRRIRVRAERILPLAQTLIDWFDGSPAGPLRLSRLDAPRLCGLDNPGWRLDGMEAVRRMAQNIAGLTADKTVAAPAGFMLALRPYQLEGLAWLQTLREHDLAGILADDMGLGKTAQTLAHLLLEKEAGRLGHPALIVLPTSLIFNWRQEAARFAPGLSVLSLQGKVRKDFFDEIPRHDLVLTTYPLLWRDAKALAQYEYSFLILDEAQMVKNAASRGAAVVRQIRARHRLCLTGTPLENHLGELWAQFDFLLPGFLGDARSFTKTWRAPIEKHGDRLRQYLLAQRIRPFLLRRSKEEVAKELPAKTFIVRSVELEAGQRDLYETVRSAMDTRVREEIAARGLSRSHIIILDALLKLRQVCCDPRLIDSAAAKKVKERAKLDQLMGMLPELVAEGRKVLVFSQFTSMLALIEAELQAIGLDYALLTGQTRDREKEVRRFQEGATPIFLISLKAGGLGLNLAAADTVIHYDPWWNPAAENQATDRAHRIGQTQPVFVYKLIVAGSIEEKIIALQEKKAQLAAAILTEDKAGASKFSEADLRALLSPLPPAR